MIAPLAASRWLVRAAMLELAIVLFGAWPTIFLAMVRVKLEIVRAASEHAKFDLGTVGVGPPPIVGMTRSELTSALGAPSTLGRPEHASEWAYLLCHHPSSYRGGGSTLVIVFPGEPPGDTVGEAHWEYGK